MPHPALLIIDMQRGMASPAAGSRNNPGAEHAIAILLAAWRKANSGHVSLVQLKVMSAIEACRTAALGGHVERCEGCAQILLDQAAHLLLLGGVVGRLEWKEREPGR